MSADEHVNKAQFHWYKPGSSKHMYSRHTPHSETRTATHPSRGVAGNKWKRKGKR